MKEREIISVTPPPPSPRADDHICHSILLVLHFYTELRWDNLVMDCSVHVPSPSDHSLKHVDKQIRAVAMRFEVFRLQ